MYTGDTNGDDGPCCEYSILASSKNTHLKAHTKSKKKKIQETNKKNENKRKTSQRYWYATATWIFPTRTKKPFLFLAFEPMLLLLLCVCFVSACEATWRHTSWSNEPKLSSSKRNKIIRWQKFFLIGLLASGAHTSGELHIFSKINMTTT